MDFLLNKDVLLLVTGAVLGGFVTVLIGRPKVTLSIADPVDLSFVGGLGGALEAFRSLRVNVANEVRWWTLLAPAVACRAKINFYDLEGRDIFNGRSMIGRWANSPTPALTFVQASDGRALAIFDPETFARESRMDIYPGDPEPLDVLVRLANDLECYGFTSETYFVGDGRRHPNWQLRPGIHLAKVTITVSGQPHIGYFRILNNGPTRDSFRMEPASSEEIDSIATEDPMNPQTKTPFWWFGQRDPIARFTLWATIAAILLAFIAFNQLREMQLENRPWVGFEVQSAGAKKGETLAALFTVKNAGKNPALKVHANFRAAYLKFNGEDGVGECGGCSTSLLLPGADIKYFASIPSDMTDYKQSAPAIFGRVDYEDASGTRYWTTICRYYEVAFSNLSSCLKGDGAGKE
jgi:hypothetical protein